METRNDFKELLASFNAGRVEFLLVGGYALAHHGAPRYTGDLDLFVHATPENAGRAIGAVCPDRGSSACPPWDRARASGSARHLRPAR